MSPGRVSTLPAQSFWRIESYTCVLRWWELTYEEYPGETFPSGEVVRESQVNLGRVSEETTGASSDQVFQEDTF
jgi:hypothetical protein